jgi:SOS-response transcriptional repressor LexA
MSDNAEYTREQELLKQLRDQRCGGNAAELARRIGKDATYVNRLLYPIGKSGRKGIGLEIMRAATEAFKLPAGFWEGADVAAPSDGTASLFVSEPWTEYQPVRPGKYQFVPVVGQGAGGDLPERMWTDGDFPVGATDEYAEVVSTDPHAFIVRVVGNSMVPKFTPGDFALVEPGTDPDLEDDVLVRLENGQTMIKRLLSRRGGQVRLGSYNATEVLVYDKEQVTWMYYVAYPVPARKIKTRV